MISPIQTNITVKPKIRDIDITLNKIHIKSCYYPKWQEIPILYQRQKQIRTPQKGSTPANG